MVKQKIKIAQWYISHTCNLSCKNCLSYNNFSISGHERWAENSEYVKRWSELVEVEDFSIIGGEPLGNPDLDFWVKGLHEYFTTKDFKICTNGTQVDRWVKEMPLWIDLGVILEIHTHDKSFVSDMWKFLRKTFPNIEYVKGKDYSSSTYYDDYNWVGLVNGKVAILQTDDWNFYPWGVKGKNEHGEYEMFETNPKITHTLCQWRNCHYFYRDQLFKCGTLVGAQKFVTKYPVKTEHKQLILDYKPVSMHSNNLEEDLANLKQFLPQCGLCNNVIKHRHTVNSTDKKEK